MDNPGCSVEQVLPRLSPRKLAKVPFVELADRRCQGVVSSGSDIERVYVSFVSAGSLGYACSTNNNRPCGGLRGNPCKHIGALLAEAVLQYGPDRVVAYLGLDVDPQACSGDGVSLASAVTGQQVKEPASLVFSRFLDHLAFLEVPPTVRPLPELDWFVTEGPE